MSDLSQVFEAADIFTSWMDISEIIRVKKLSIHPDSFRLGIQSIDPFHGFYIACIGVGPREYPTLSPFARKPSCFLLKVCFWL